MAFDQVWRTLDLKVRLAKLKKILVLKFKRRRSQQPPAAEASISATNPINTEELLSLNDQPPKAEENADAESQSNCDA